MALQLIATPSTSGTYARPSKLNVFILDVSGSMGHAMKHLGEDTAQRIRQLPLRDAVLVGLFSSEGWYQWLPGRTLTEPQDYDQIAAMVMKELYPRNTTCFSEILTDTPKAIAPFLAGYQVVTLTFMSDGCAVVRDTAKEYAALDAAAKTLAPSITAGAVVAYGDYADLKVLRGLATTLGVEFVTTDSVGKIGETFTKHAQSPARARRKVAVPDAGKLTFAREPDGTVTPLKPTEGEVSVSDTAHVYTITQNGDDAPWVAQTPEDLVYSSALGYLRQGNRDAAVAMLAMLGDVAQVAALNNALTNAELATAEGMIQDAITTPAKRFTAGRQPGCLPRDDAFDLLDVLGLLIDDDTARFWPMHEGFRYRRIGAATTTAEAYPTFHREHVGVPLKELVGNAKELNLSVRFPIPGTIVLPTQMGTMTRPESLPPIFQTFLWRNYAAVANALPVMTRLPVTMSEETYRHLCAEHVIQHRQKYDPARIEVLHLDRVPMCSKARGRDAADWDRMAELSLASFQLGCALKVYRDRLATLRPTAPVVPHAAYTADEAVFLVACGIRLQDGSYAPPQVASTTKDVLTIRVFEVKPEHSSNVSMADLQKMQEGKKKWNFVGTLMQDAWETLAKTLPVDAPGAIAWLVKEIPSMAQQKRRLDHALNSQRFAVALTGLWPQTFATESVVNNAAGHPIVMSFRTIQKPL